MSELNRTSQAALDEARRKDWRVVVPDPYELQIDIDNEDAKEAFDKRYDKARELGLVSSYSAQPSKSGTEGRYHITVRVPNRPSPVERIALQAILGSDWLRELLSYNRLSQGDPIPTLFFEKP